MKALIVYLNDGIMEDEAEDVLELIEGLDDWVSERLPNPIDHVEHVTAHSLLVLSNRWRDDHEI